MVERLGDALAVFAGAQAVLVGWIADERNLGKDGGHVGTDEHDERCLLHAAIADGGTSCGQAAVQGFLNVGGEFAGFFDFFFQGNLLDQILKLVDGCFGDGILAGGNFESIGRGSEVQIIGLNAACVGIVAGVGMDRDEQVGALLIGDGGAGFERDEGIVLAGVDDFGAEAGLEQFAETAADVENQVFLFYAVGADSAGIVAAVSGIDDNLADLEAE